MNFFTVLGKMLVILFAMVLGYVSNKLGYLGGEADQKLSKLLLHVTLPCMIVAAVLTGEDLGGAETMLSVLKVSVVYYGLAFLCALVVPRLLGGTAEQRGVWRFSTVFSNVGFIGYPVVTAIFGESALFYAAILALPFNLLSFSLGPLMLAGASRFQWKSVFSPCVVASVTALIFALTGFRAPAMITGMVDFVGDVTVPLSLLMVGSLLAGLPAREILASWRIWVLTALRLLVLPAVLFLLLRPMELDPLIRGIAITQMAMPVAVNGVLMSMQYGGDTEAMAQSVFLTTLASIVTIPLIAAVFL